MKRSRFLITLAGIPLLIGALLAPLAMAPRDAHAALADPAFQQVWDRADRAVMENRAVRSWMWGPDAFQTAYEPYVQGPGGQHLVAYFDKSRMEINDPAAPRESAWFVTNGLLVVDMISGKVQIGNNEFMQRSPAGMPVAGDTATSYDAPTYATLAAVASVNATRRAADRTGQPVSATLNRAGAVGAANSLAGYTHYAYYEPTLGHNVAGIFWSFLHQRGPVYQNGRYDDGVVVDWLFAMGYPITEPYWIQIRVGSETRWALMQAFQRRILTYTPTNPAAWQVEMGNVGRAYYDWRYNPAPAQPTPVPPTATPLPAVAAISLDATSGEAGDTVTITGAQFPAHAAVTLGIARADGSAYRALRVVAADGTGAFKAAVTIPTDFAPQSDVILSATANAGAIRATAGYTLSYHPTIAVVGNEVVTNGQIEVRGAGFPGDRAITLGALFGSAPVEWLGHTRSDAHGAFDAYMPIGARTVGAGFRVLAVSDNGMKAASAAQIRVIAQPVLQVSPASGPANVRVTLYGYGWPANRGLTVGVAAPGSGTTAWEPGSVQADGAGKFAVAVSVGPQYVPLSEVRLVAFEPVSLVRVEAVYRIVGPPAPGPTPAPGGPSLTLNPRLLAVGQVATVSGAGWPVATDVSLGVAPAPGQAIDWIESLRTDGYGRFTMGVKLSARWQNAGQIMLVAHTNAGLTARTPVLVLPAAARIAPLGLPLTVQRAVLSAGGTVKVSGAGWQPGAAVAVSVVSADGAVDAPMGAAVAGPDGALVFSFSTNSAWAGRADLGVWVTADDGSRFALAYLPLTTLTKSGAAYTISGANWPPNTPLVIIGHVANKAAGEVVDVTLGRATSDGAGAWSVTISPPRFPAGSKNDIEVRASGQPYSVSIDF